MAGNAVIGSLRVALGLDSASFEAGLKKAQKGLSGWQAAAIGGFAAVAAAGIAAGAALEHAMGKAIDRFDEMGKASQKVGVSVEALSRLEYAARLSDISLDQLTGGLQKLSKGMADVAAGSSGPAATAFSALGVSVTTATGQLRGADEVFADVAEKFSRMEDGSTKTALAMGIFGKSGAELIPVLNEGRAGLAALADESDRFGNTISTAAARNADNFGDNIEKVQIALGGIVNVLTAAVLPVLSYLSEAFAGAAGDSRKLEKFASDLVDILKVLVTISSVAVTSVKVLGEAVGGLMAATMIAQTGFQNWGLASKMLEGTFTNLQAEIGATKEFIDGLWAAMDKGPKPGWGAKLPFGPDAGNGASTFTPPNFVDTSGADAAAARLESLRASLRTEEEAENASYAKRQEAIRGFLDDKAITSAEYDDLMLKAQQDHSDKMVEIAKDQAEKEAQIREQLVGNVAGIFGSLSTLAENMGEKGLAASKAFGVAEAIVNTAQGITKALAQGGALGFVGAAAVAAAGAAQISTILSTQKGSGTKPSAGGGVSTAAVATPAPAPEARRAVNVTLVGGSRYSRAEVEGLIRDINDGLSDGMKLNVSAA